MFFNIFRCYMRFSYVDILWFRLLIAHDSFYIALLWFIVSCSCQVAYFGPLGFLFTMSHLGSILSHDNLQVFVISYCEVDFEVLIILGQSFLATGMLKLICKLKLWTLHSIMKKWLSMFICRWSTLVICEWFKWLI